MYLHYWCRPTTFAIKEYDEQKDYLIYADTTTDKPFELTPELILKRSHRSKVKYYAKVLWFNRKKITGERIVFHVQGLLNYKKEGGSDRWDFIKYMINFAVIGGRSTC